MHQYAHAHKHKDLNHFMAAINSYSITAVQIVDPDAFRKKVHAKLAGRFITVADMTPDAAKNAGLNLERGIIHVNNYIDFLLLNFIFTVTLYTL
jgi:hypothetical protein